MKNPVLKEADYKKLALNCIICGKSVEGWYASFEVRGVCSKKCMLEQDEKIRQERQVQYQAFCVKFNLKE